MNYFETARLADDAFKNKNLDELYALTDVLIKSEISEHIGSGYFLRGGYFECYGNDLNDLTKAIENYNLAAQANPSAEVYAALATVIYRLGPEHDDSAIVCLKEASKINHIPEINLGFAYIFMRKSPPDYSLAKSFFLKAALRGRVQGFLGYSFAARKLGQYFRAIIIDLCRVIFSPFIFLFIGKKMIKGFRVAKLDLDMM